MIIIIIIAVLVVLYFLNKEQKPILQAHPVPELPVAVAVDQPTVQAFYAPVLKATYNGLDRPLTGPNVGQMQIHHKLDDMRVESRYKPRTSDLQLSFISPALSSTPVDIRGPIEM